MQAYVWVSMFLLLPHRITRIITMPVNQNDWARRSISLHHTESLATGIVCQSKGNLCGSRGFSDPRNIWGGGLRVGPPGPTVCPFYTALLRSSLRSPKISASLGFKLSFLISNYVPWSHNVMLSCGAHFMVQPIAFPPPRLSLQVLSSWLAFSMSEMIFFKKMLLHFEP